MINLTIKPKYFNAILKLDKLFEIRHKRIKQGEIVVLNEIDDNNKSTGRYITFKAGKSEKINESYTILVDKKWGHTSTIVENHATPEFIVADFQGGSTYKVGDSWYDEFCWNYIQEKDSYIIPIEEIIEVRNGK